MTTSTRPTPKPQVPASDEVELLRHALGNAAAAIAGLLSDHPTPADARATARAWLLTWETFGDLAVARAALDRIDARRAGGAR